MKRIIEKYDPYFIKDGKRIFCTSVTVPYSELPEDCDFSGLTVTPMNVLYDDCHIRIQGFDNNQNSISVEIPSTLKFLLYKAEEQGQKECFNLIEKFNFETRCIKSKKDIHYSNTVVPGHKKGCLRGETKQLAILDEETLSYDKVEDL